VPISGTFKDTVEPHTLIALHEKERQKQCQFQALLKTLWGITPSRYCTKKKAEAVPLSGHKKSITHEAPDRAHSAGLLKDAATPPHSEWLCTQSKKAGRSSAVARADDSTY